MAAGPGDRYARHGPPAPLTPAVAARTRLAGPAAGVVAVILAGSLARAAAPGGTAGRVPATFAFGALLLGLVAVAVMTGAVDLKVRATPKTLVLGAVVGLALLVPGLLLRLGGRPATLDVHGIGYLLPLVPALTWVAAAEELALRGALQPLLRRALGPGAAILATAAVFAAMHLATYGWAAMPLDLGVGLLLGWLREETRGVAAPVAAHLVADLGGWFLA